MSRALSLSKVVLSILLACVFSGASGAALIAEIGINIPPAFENDPPPTNSVLYQFGVLSHSPTLVGGEYSRQVTAADLGLTFEVPGSIVNPIAESLTRLNAEVGIRVHNIAYGRPLDQLQSSGWGIIDDRATFHKFVPDITKVSISRITMTIDSFSFTRFGDDASIGGGHTIRLYGVPEPASCILICIGSLVSIRRFGRKLLGHFTL